MTEKEHLDMKFSLFANSKMPKEARQVLNELTSLNEDSMYRDETTKNPYKKKKKEP